MERKRRRDCAPRAGRMPADRGRCPCRQKGTKQRKRLPRVVGRAHGKLEFRLHRGRDSHGPPRPPARTRASCCLYRRRGRARVAASTVEASRDASLHDWFFRHGGRKRLIDWLGIDAWIDSVAGGDLADAAGPLERRLQLLCALPSGGLEAPPQRGRRRGLDDRRRRLGGALRAGHPRHQRVRREQDQHGQVRGQVPRPQRHRDRPARHPAQRRRAARGDPRPPHQGYARHRGPPLLRALRRRLHRHCACPVRERARQRGGAGRLDAHPAARQEPVPVLGALGHAQAQGGVPGLPARVALHQARDPEALPRPRLSRRRRLRRGGGVPVLLRQVRARDQPGRSRADGRPLQGAVASSPRTSTCRPRARAPTTCSPTWSRPAT